MANYFTINGIVDTNNSVLDNLNTIANASGCFLTWDTNAGKWIVILNTTGTSVKSFTDSNILGEIKITGSGVNELYNKVSLSYPHKDIKNTVDVVEVEIPSADRYPQEIDNTLQLGLPIVNDPLQAQYIASRELKQNRLDTIVEFRANFEANSVRAGDLIDITNTAYDYTNKVFRVIQIEEADDDDGNLIFSVLAQEYNADVYSTAGLTYENRSDTTGTKSKIFNAEIDAKDDYADGASIGRLLAGNLVTGLLKSLFTTDDDTETVEQEILFDDPAKQALMEAGGKKPNLIHTPSTTEACSENSVTISLAMPTECTSNCFFEAPDYEYDYTITGVTTDEINVDLTGTVQTTAGSGSLVFTVDVSEEKTATVTIGGNSSAITFLPAPDEYIANTTATSTTITEGDTFTVNVTTAGKEDADTLNYEITGTATGKVTSPASLTGTVSITSNATSLEIVTSDDSEFNAAENLVITFTPQPTDYCGLSGPNSVTVTVNNNAGTGPQPDPDTTCEYVSVPLVWCAIYDGEDDELTDVTVRRSAYLPVAQAGESTVSVPTAISVTKGNPATITITSTVDVASSSSLGGIPYQVITGFNTVAAKGLITGSSTSTIYGYDF